MENTIEETSFRFAIRIVKLYRYLSKKEHAYQLRLTNIIRTRLRGRLIGSGIIIVIDGRQPIGFLCFA